MGNLLEKVAEKREKWEIIATIKNEVTKQITKNTFPLFLKNEKYLFCSVAA